MQLVRACVSILDQLEDVASAISDEDYARPSRSLGSATIGQHLRHTIEFFLCLEKGFGSGIINYDKRDHDRIIESDRAMAILAIQRVRQFIQGTDSNQQLRLEVGYDRHSEECMTIDTNYSRELIYNIEHAVHHMAIMKIGLREIAAYIVIPTDFGIAVSTLRHKESIARAR